MRYDGLADLRRRSGGRAMVSAAEMDFQVECQSSFYMICITFVEERTRWNSL